MFAYLAIGALGLLGWALYGSNSPKSGGSTPLQNSMTGSPYQVGQTVRVPFNQLPPNTIPPAMMATFQQVQADGVKIKITAVQPGTLSGNLISTYGPGGDIMMPTPLPLTVPTAIVAGLA
jgi:hypothetical protein